MKALLTTIAAVLFSLTLSAQCNDIFISEIVEGWSNNKAVELYNPTNSVINLSNYGLARSQNSGGISSEVTYLQNCTIQPLSTFVVVIDKRDSLGTVLETPVWPDLQEAADTFINPTYNNGTAAMYFNGNDAIALFKNSSIIDWFGSPNEPIGFGGWGF